MSWDGKARFSREVPDSDPREIWADGGKWEPFFDLIKKAKADGAHSIVVDRPEALGDTYREIILMLSTIAASGLKLEITKGAGTVVDSEIEFTVAGEKEVSLKRLFTEKRLPFVRNCGKVEGPFVLRCGKKPEVFLASVGPDEAYCQAELLLLAEQEAFKPASKGRTLVGAYEITEGGSLEAFLEKHPGKDERAVMENHRAEIQKQGWSFFCASIGNSVAIQEEARALRNALKLVPKGLRSAAQYKAGKDRLKEIGEL